MMFYLILRTGLGTTSGSMLNWFVEGFGWVGGPGLGLGWAEIGAGGRALGMRFSGLMSRPGGEFGLSLGL